MHRFQFKALLALLIFAGTATLCTAQNATLIADDHDGIVVRFDFSDPILHEVNTPDGVALMPRVLDDTPLLRDGAPDLSKVDATVIIDASVGTALEIVETEFVDFTDVEVAPKHVLHAAMMLRVVGHVPSALAVREEASVMALFIPPVPLVPAPMARRAPLHQ